MSGLPVSQVQPKTIPPSHWIIFPVVSKHPPPQGIPNLVWYTDHTRLPAKPPPQQAPQFSSNQAAIAPRHDPPKSPQDSPKGSPPPPKHAGHFSHGANLLATPKPKGPPPPQAKHGNLSHGANTLVTPKPKAPPRPKPFSVFSS